MLVWAFQILQQSTTIYGLGIRLDYYILLEI